MKKFLFLMSAAALLFTTSCLSGSNPGSSSANYNGILTVTDLQSGAVSYSDNNCSIMVSIPNILEPIFDFRFKGIKFDNAMPKLNIDIDGIPFTTTISEDETSINYLFEAKDIIPTAGGIKYESFKVGEIKGCIGKEVEITFTMPSKNKKAHFKTVSNNATEAIEE